MGGSWNPVDWVDNAVSSVGDFVQNDIINPVSDAFAGIGNFVDNSIPGGWATVGGAALMAVGIYDPELLALADSGSLTEADLANAGYDASTVSTDIGTAVQNGTLDTATISEPSVATPLDNGGYQYFTDSAGNQYSTLAEAQAADAAPVAQTYPVDMGAPVESTPIPPEPAPVADVAPVTPEPAPVPDVAPTPAPVAPTATADQIAATQAAEDMAAGPAAGAVPAGGGLSGDVYGGTGLFGGTTTAADLAKLAAMGVIAPSVLNAAGNLLGIGPNSGSANPYGNYYAGQAPWSLGQGIPVVESGVNPGYVGAMASHPYYNTENPTQSQYYWGVHPGAQTMGDILNYNNVAGAPATPWGSTNTAVGGQAHLNVPQFVQNTFGPQWQEAATGSSAQYPTGAPLAPIAPTTGVSGV